MIDVKKILIVLSVFSILLMTSCKKNPEACMEVSSTNVTVGEEVTFTSCSKDALSYDWYFVGPVGAPENNIGNSEITFTHQFSTSGTYTVKHVAFEKFSFLGKSDTTETVVVVN